MVLLSSCILYEIGDLTGWAGYSNAGGKRGVERQAYTVMGLMINIGFYVCMLFYMIKSFHMYRKRGGLKGKDVALVKEGDKDLEGQAVEAAMMM